MLEELGSIKHSIKTLETTKMTARLNAWKKKEVKNQAVEYFLRKKSFAPSDDKFTRANTEQVFMFLWNSCFSKVMSFHFS